MEQDSGASLWKRLGGQGALLFSGFALAQGLSFGRNAIIGHWLSRGDFGVAATLTLLLQLVEMLSDVGVDRMIVQARDGEEPRLQSNAHTALIFRGMITSVALFLAAYPVAVFFRIEDALPAFYVISLVPLIKGFVHLDPRRYQRVYRNGPQMFVEVVPQAVAFALVVPVLSLFPDYVAVVWLSIGQAAGMVIVSHWVSERPYRAGFHGAFLMRLFHFGWPIWLSAIPLIAVYQSDRIIIGRVFGMEAFAGFSAAFMLTMVPGLIAAKVGNSLMLPLLSSARENNKLFVERFTMLADVSTVVACVYAFGFVSLGGLVLPLAFGPNYYGLEVVVAWLAVMWAVRMFQAVPGMGLMAFGDTRPLLVAGFIRCLGFPLACAFVWAGFDLVGVIWAGIAAECASLVFVSWRMSRDVKGCGLVLLPRVALLVPACLGAFVLSAQISGSSITFALAMFVGILGSVLIGLRVAAGLPFTRQLTVWALSRVVPALRQAGP